MSYFIEKDLSKKVLMVSVIFRTSKPCGGGVSTVLECYDKYFNGLRHIPTWKRTNAINKVWYFAYHYLWFILLMIFDRRIRIVHVHTAERGSFYRKMMVAKTASFFKKKVIIHMHAADFKEFYQDSNDKQGIVKSLNVCDRLIALSPSWRDFYVSIGLPEQKVIILNNIITPPQKPNNRKFEYPVRMHFFGHLAKRKGIWDLLEVLKEHNDELRGKYFLRFGGNEYEDEIKKLIAENQLDDVAKFEGWAHGKLKEDILKWSDILILPSYNEGLPIAILEAMSYGMPIISTPVGGIPVVVKNYHNGILVTPGNKEEIWQSLKFFIDNPAKISEYGHKSLEIVKEFTPECVMSSLKDIYKNLLKE